VPIGCRCRRGKISLPPVNGFWDNRSVISNSGAAWQNPGGGFGVGCLTWGPQNDMPCDTKWAGRTIPLDWDSRRWNSDADANTAIWHPNTASNTKTSPDTTASPDTATLAAATQRKRACHPAVWAKGNFLWSQVFLWSAILASFGSAILSAGSANRILVAIFCGHSRDSHCH